MSPGQLIRIYDKPGMLSAIERGLTARGRVGMAGVTVSTAALRKAWRDGGEESVWVCLRTRTPVGAARVALEAAMATANDVEWETRDGEPRIGGGSVSVTPDGPVAWVDFCDEATALDEWLGRVAETLTAAGITGKL